MTNFNNNTGDENTNNNPDTNGYNDAAAHNDANNTNSDNNNNNTTNAEDANPHATQHAHPTRNKVAQLTIMSQNVNGKTRGHSAQSCLTELLFGMLKHKCQIALLQDTQQGYPCATDEDLDPRLAIHGQPGEFQLYHGDEAPPTTQPVETEHPTDPLWPFGAVWSDSDRNVNSVRGSAGVAIVMGKLASDAHHRAIEKLGHDKAILNISPRLLAVRLIFLDARGKMVQFLVASAYAPPYSTNAAYAGKIGTFYNNMNTLMDEVTGDDVLIIGGDLNAHVGSNRPIRRRAVIQCPAIGDYGVQGTNAAGTKLRDYATSNDLRFATTFFEPPKTCWPTEIAKWKNTRFIRQGGYGASTFIRGGKCYQLDHFLACAKDMKRINYAGPVKEQLISSDHKTIKLTIKIARNLKKSQPRPEESDLSQIGTKIVAAEGGGTKEVPTQHTTNFIDAANAIFESIDIGPFQSTAQETDKMYAAVVKALIEATKVLPKKKKHKPWFAKGHLGIQDVHEKIVKCMADLNTPEITQQQKTILKRTYHWLRRQRQRMINGAKEVYYKDMENLIQVEGESGPSATSGRREWAVRKQMMDAFQSRKKQRTGIVKITDENTNKAATDSNDRARILEEYANELYQTSGMDEEMLNKIQQAPTPTSVPDTTPEDDEILAAINRVKSRKARTDTPAELWKALLMDKSKSGNIIKVLTRMIKEQYQGISKSECLSNVSAKILNKPGKSKSGLMKNKRIIVLQPFCTCVLEIICRDRLEKICEAHIDKYLFQYGHTSKKGTQEALFVHRRWLELRKATELDTYVLNLDVVKAFDKMSPKMIYPLIRKLGAPPTLVAAIEHLYKTRTMTFKNSTASVGQTENRTLLMQGGSLGPTMYKCLKLGVMLSLNKEDVWIDHGTGPEPWKISNDFSHELRKLNSQNGLTYGWTYDITLAMILFADDMQLYFDSRRQLEAGAKEFINHLKRWGLHVHVAENEEEKSKSTVMYVQGNQTAEIGATLPLKVPGGWIRFVEEYKFLGSIFTHDLKLDKEIKNRRNTMLGNLQQYKDAISSKHLSLAFRKTIVRVCLDECLFYGAETMTLNANHIKQYTSARMFVLRAMRQITRWDQHYHHISGKTMLNENKMATCAEKIRRRTFGFWKKIICEAPVLSPERMLMGRPCIVWEGLGEGEAYPPTRNNGYATTMQKYLTDRAMQIYYYTEVLNKPVEFDQKRLMKQLLNFGDTQAERTSQEHWMQIMKESPKLWDWVVKYGQFEPRNDEETDQQRRRRRQNTFAPELPQAFAAQHGGLAALRNRMKTLA